MPDFGKAVATGFPFRGEMGYGQTMTDRHFTILLGGPLTTTPRLAAQLAGSRVIAADGGMRHADTLGVTPELWVGDFDSTDPALIERHPHVPRQPYPTAKAETDGDIAIGEALSRGATMLTLAGALGGERSDHAVQHLLSALRLALAGHTVMLTSGEEEAYPILPGRCRLDAPAGALFSVLGLEPLEGLTLSNARYPLEDFKLAFGSSRTISNVALGPVEIDLRAGRAILLLRPFDMTGA